MSQTGATPTAFRYSMALDPSSLRIGVVDQANTSWVAAAVYSRTILSSLDQACNSAGAELFFLSGNCDQLPEKYRAKRMRLSSTDYLPAERQLRRLFGIKEKSRALRGGHACANCYACEANPTFLVWPNKTASTFCYRCLIFRPGELVPVRSGGFPISNTFTYQSSSIRVTSTEGTRRFAVLLKRQLW